MVRQCTFSQQRRGWSCDAFGLCCRRCCEGRDGQISNHLHPTSSFLPLLFHAIEQHGKNVFTTEISLYFYILMQYRGCSLKSLMKTTHNCFLIFKFQEREKKVLFMLRDENVTSHSFTIFKSIYIYKYIYTQTMNV